MQKKAIGLIVVLTAVLAAYATWRMSRPQGDDATPLAASLAAANPTAAARLTSAVSDLRTRPQRLAVLLGDDDWQVRAAACEALGPRADAALAPLLVARASDSDWRVRAVALEAMARLAQPPASSPGKNTPLDQREQFLLAWLKAYDSKADVKLTPDLCEIYADSEHLEFGRPLAGRCLQCHVGAPQQPASAAEACKSCHGDIHAGWSASAHANSLTHLLLNTIDANTRQPARMDFSPLTGISCIECHRPLPAGPVASSQAASGTAACPYRFDANQPPTKSCIRCHETTWRQWQAWSARPHPVRRVWPPGQIGMEDDAVAVTCVDCHMKRTGSDDRGPRSHSWSARRNLTMLIDGVDARIAAAPDQNATLTLTNFAGHDYPTASRRRALAIVSRTAEDAEPLPLALLVPNRAGQCDTSVLPALSAGERRSLPLRAGDEASSWELWYIRHYSPGTPLSPFQILLRSSSP